MPNLKKSIICTTAPLIKLNMTPTTLANFFSDFTPEILDTEVEDDGTLILFTFEFVRYEPGEDLYPIMRIRAENVTVGEL